MRIIHIQARYSDTLAELSGVSEQDAALAIESAVSVALLELCGEVTMDCIWFTEETEALTSGVGYLHNDGSN
jgi:hypothetical protein